MANFGSSVTSDDTGGIVAGHAGTGGVSAGDAVYKSSTTGKWIQAQSNATSTLGQAGIKGDMGVALNTAAANQPVDVLVAGYLEGCSSLAPGGIYCVSDSAAGDVILSASLTEDTDYAAIMGVATAATTAWINPINAGVVVNLV